MGVKALFAPDGENKNRNDKEKTPCHTNKGVIYSDYILITLFAVILLLSTIKRSKPVFLRKLSGLDIRGLFSLWSLSDIKTHFLAFFKSFKSRHIDC